MYSSKNEEPSSAQNEEFILKKYGCILTLEEIKSVLKYPSISAVRKAHSRKTLPIKLYRFKGRAGYYAKAEEIIDCIEKMEES